MTLPVYCHPLNDHFSSAFGYPFFGVNDRWKVYAAPFENRPKGIEPQADLGFADPPYNIGINYGSGKQADRMTDDGYLEFTRSYLELFSEDIRPGGAVWVLVPDEWAAEVVWIAKREYGFDLRNWVKWYETFGAQTTKKFARCSRHLLYFVRPGGPFTFDGDAVRIPSARQLKYNDRRANPKGKIPGDVWEFPRVCGTFRERAKGFPTQLPEAMLERIILSTSRPDDHVLEFCSGSGSLGIVCKRHGRRYEGWERNGDYAEKAAARIFAACPDFPVDSFK